jgi:hypothetical protein
MASPSGAGGRPKGDGFVFGAGTRYATEWWDQALYHWANVVAGGLSTIIKGFLVEPAKQVYDIGGGALEMTVKGLELGNYEHKFVSGIGQMGNVGVGGAFKAMGKGLIGTPGRLWDAMEKGDYYGIGAEGLNVYMMGRSAAEMTNLGNWGVRGLGLLGKRGQQWRFQIREWQVARMEAAANKVLQQAGKPPIEFQYGGVSDAAFGEVISGNKIPLIYESAFTPSPLSVLRGPQVGGTLGQSALATLRYHVSSALRGNTTLRTMVHEGWHVRQMAALGEPWFEELAEVRPYETNPLEWTQPGSTLTGAWNFEMNTPIGNWTKSPTWLAAPTNASTEAEPQ